MERPAGVVVAVRTDSNEGLALNVLRSHSALEIERTTGEWRDGSWIDFDPRRRAQRV